VDRTANALLADHPPQGLYLFAEDKFEQVTEGYNTDVGKLEIRS